MDGNCGYHGMIQGLLESYFLMGSKSNENLKKFVKEVEQKLNVNVKEIIVKNRDAEYISIPREVINYFRNFILGIRGNRITQSGEKAHIFEREDEVATKKYDNKLEKFTKRAVKKNQIKKNRLDNKQLIDKIKGGDLQSNSIPKKYWLNEKVIVGCQGIFKVPFYCFMTYTDTNLGVNKAIWNPCNGDVFDCGHIIFIENNGNHFTLMTTDLQDYNNNILKCIGATTKDKQITEPDTESSDLLSDDVLSSDTSDSDSSPPPKPKPNPKQKKKTLKKSSSSKSTSESGEGSALEDKIEKLMLLGINKSAAEKMLKEANGDVEIAAAHLLQSDSDKSSQSMTLGSISSVKDLNEQIDFNEHEELYKVELLKIITKKYKGTKNPQPKIKKEFNKIIHEIKNKK